MAILVALDGPTGVDVGLSMELAEEVVVMVDDKDGSADERRGRRGV